MVSIGLGMIVAFLALRTLNRYGDPVPWSSEIPGKTWLSFLRCTKYPPSLDYLLMTLGPALLVLAWFDRLNFSSLGPSGKNPLLVFGRVPLFFFLLHFLLIHLLLIPFSFFRYGKVAFLLNLIPTMGGANELYPSDFGYGLGTVYGVWILVLVMMYPACLWFCRLKERRRDRWLSYT
jgi:predicted acyltransferase